MKIYTFSPDDYFGSNTYLIECGGEYAVVDPSVDLAVVERKHPNLKGRVKFILLTHAHFDHFLKIDSWLSESSDVIIGEADAKALSDSVYNCYLGFLGVMDGYFGEYRAVNDSETLTLGDKTVRIIACPGHTPGGVAYKIGANVFIGDTLFENGGYGRCDLPGGDIDELSRTLMRLFACLNDDNLLYPGHGGTTTIKEAKKYFL